MKTQTAHQIIESLTSKNLILEVCPKSRRNKFESIQVRFDPNFKFSENTNLSENLWFIIKQHKDEIIQILKSRGRIETESTLDVEIDDEPHQPSYHSTLNTLKYKPRKNMNW